MTSMRLPASTSLTSWTERSWPTASGVSVSGSGTVSRSGRTGQRRRAASPLRADLDGLRGVVGGDLDHAASSCAGPRSARCAHARLGRPRAAARRAGSRRGRSRAPRRRTTSAPSGITRRNGPKLDLELLVDAALGVGRPAVAGDDQLAALDLEAELVGVDARELGVHDRARRVAVVEDVDARARTRRGARPSPAARRRRRTARPSRGACARSSRRGRAPGTSANV